MLNSIWLTVGAYVAQGANLLTYVLAARYLGPAVFGALTAGIGLAIVAATFADFGINGWAIRAVARDPKSPDSFVRTLTAKLVLSVLLAALWITGSFLFESRAQLSWAFGLLGIYLLLLVVAGTLTVPLRASEQMATVSVIGVAEKLTTLVAWLVLHAALGSSPVFLPLAMVIGSFASVCVALAFMPKSFLRIARPSFTSLASIWRYSFSFGMVGVSAQIQRADVAIVSVLAGPYAAGIYAAPARLTSFLGVVPASFSAALYPRLAGASGDKSARRDALLSGTGVLLLMVLGMLIVYVKAPVVVGLALGSAYESSTDVLRIYLLVVLLNSVNQPLLAVLQAEGEERYGAVVVIASAIAGLGAVALGARLYGAPGAALGVVVLQGLQVLLFAPKALQMGRRVGGMRPVADLTEDGLGLSLVSSDTPREPDNSRA